MQYFSIDASHLGTQHCELKELSELVSDDFEAIDMDDFEEPAPAGFEAIRVPDESRRRSSRRFTRALAARRSSQRRTFRDFN